MIACGPTFEHLLALAFEPLARHARNAPEALESLERAARAIELAAPPQRRAEVRHYLEEIRG